MRSGIENLVRRESMLKIASAAAVIALCVPTHASAQTPVQPPDGATTTKHVFVRVAGPPEGEGAAVRSFAWTEADTVTQAPYSAEAVTEVTQTLSDGNRINQRTVSKIYRDSAGRVRREQALAGVGPIGAAADGTRIVFINDPVAKAMYTLDSARQEARKLPLDINVVMARSPEPGYNVVDDRRVERKIVVAGAGGAQEHVSKSIGEGDGPMKHIAVMTGAMDPTELPRGASEPLGGRSIDGVNAEGTRWTQTIPAGALGNERPIEIVTERWYSPELKTVVLAKHSDPRLGETVYQLTNIIRQEPPADLFVVPADYKVVEGPGVAISHKVQRQPE